MAELADDIAAAERHIAEARQILAVHLDRIKQLLDAGADVGDAESRLQVFETNLRVFEKHLEWLLQQGISS